MGRAQQANSPRPHRINHCRFLLAHQHVICQISCKSTAIGWYLNYLMLKALIFPDKIYMTFLFYFCIFFSNFKESLRELIINWIILYYNIDFITNFQGAIFSSLKDVKCNTAKYFPLSDITYVSLRIERNYACFALKLKTANLKLWMPLVFNLCHNWMQ